VERAPAPPARAVKVAVNPSLYLYLYLSPFLHFLSLRGYEVRTERVRLRDLWPLRPLKPLLALLPPLARAGEKVVRLEVEVAAPADRLRRLAERAAELAHGLLLARALARGRAEELDAGRWLRAWRSEVNGSAPLIHPLLRARRARPSFTGALRSVIQEAVGSLRARGGGACGAGETGDIQ
jgi:hypothetical protein